MNQEIFDSQVRQVLEDGALLFADPASESAVGGDEGIRLQLEFTGEVKGRIRLACAAGVGEQIARNLLGLDEAQDCDDELRRSSLAEILNILGGTVLAGLSSSGGGVQMLTPMPDAGDFRSANRLENFWSIDGMPMAVTLEWQEA